MTGALICDEHLLFAEALASALKRRGVEATAVADFDEGLAGLGAQPAYVVLGGRSGALGEGAIRLVRERCPDSWLVCVVAGGTPASGTSYAMAGADLVLSKERSLRVLVDGVLASPVRAWRGNGASPVVGLGHVARGGGRGPLAAHFLTNREREVLRLLALGASTRQISDSLGIASVTARSYVQDAMTKLGVHSRLEAVRYVMLNSVV